MSKAKVISVLNHKGGVGKTTTTINLGGALRQKGYKVLLIDLDGQANLTESLGFSAELPQTIYGAMKGEYDLPIYEHKDGLSVVPSCLDLSAVETELINEAGRELILAHLIKGQKEKFDYILIDCPPSLSLLTLNALTASDRLIIPVQAQFLAMRGMAKLMQVVHKVQQRLNSDLSIAGVLITQYDGRKNLNKSCLLYTSLLLPLHCMYGWFCPYPRPPVLLLFRQPTILSLPCNPPQNQHRRINCMKTRARFLFPIPYLLLPQHHVLPFSFHILEYFSKHTEDRKAAWNLNSHRTDNR